MEYFSRANPRSPSRPNSSQTPLTPSAAYPATPGGASLRKVNTATEGNDYGTESNPRPKPSVRLRRLPSSPLLRPTTSSQAANQPQSRNTEQTGRRRSFSDPQRPVTRGNVPTGDTRRQQHQQNAAEPMPALTEETSQPVTPQPATGLQVPQDVRNRGASDATSTAAEWVLNRPRRSSSTASKAWKPNASRNYERDVVDVLDVIDPEVSALTTLNNIQNSLFIPNLGRFLNRQPTYDLSGHPTPLTRQPTVDESKELELKGKETDSGASIFGAPLAHSHSISSVLSDTNFAVLPHGVVLEGWSEDDKAELNDHVRHLLHSRKANFRRSMRAFGKYVRTPLGAFVTIYAFLITFWGAAWVLFIIGWLSVAGRQAYFIEVCDQVLTALFAVMGIGLAPFRAVDTYHMIFVAIYHYKTLKMRKAKKLPDLPDINDLPEVSPEGDVEAHPAKPEDAVLTEEQQKKFHHHQAKFAKSHTYYKPHQTFTHRAFPIDLLITVVVLLDFHSFFQMALGGTTWGIYYKRRPKALTAVILTCSICCNIAGGLVIKVGDGKTRKKDVVERIFRQALTEEALQKMEKKKGLTATDEETALEHSVLRNKEATEAVDAQNATNADVAGTILTT